MTSAQSYAWFEGRTLTVATSPSFLPTPDDQKVCDAFAAAKVKEFYKKNERILNKVRLKLSDLHPVTGFGVSMSSQGHRSICVANVAFGDCDLVFSGPMPFNQGGIKMDCRTKPEQILAALRTQFPDVLEIEYDLFGSPGSATAYCEGRASIHGGSLATSALIFILESRHTAVSTRHTAVSNG